MRDICFIYATFQDKAEASNIAAALLEGKLCACVNIFENMTSMYKWEGETVEDNECVMIVKTLSHLCGKVTEMIRSKHSYQNPCIVSINGTAETDDFFNWINTETMKDE